MWCIPQCDSKFKNQQKDKSSHKKTEDMFKVSHAPFWFTHSVWSFDVVVLTPLARFDLARIFRLAC